MRLRVQLNISQASAAQLLDIELNTPRKILYPHTPMYYSLFLWTWGEDSAAIHQEWKYNQIIPLRTSDFNICRRFS